MGDVLPPKRQTVVERLRRRLELYRRHQGSCQPRYDQAANGICDAQRNETMILKQRFLEAKAKKTKRNDTRQHSNNVRDNSASLANNNISNNSNNDTKNNIVAHSKIKRSAGSPLLDCAIEGLEGHPNKIPRNSTPEHYNGTKMNNNNNNSNAGSNNKKQSSQQQPGMQSFSVQIVQQFNTSQAPHSQTIQTNVTVQTLSGGSIKTANSPLTANTVSASPGNTSDVNNLRSSAPPNSNNVGTSISVGTSIECKQEPDMDFAPCSMNNIANHQLNDIHCTNNNANNVNTCGAGDRFSDSLANLGFPEDSSDDVIHPDILKDIIDDVFTNPSDLMNGFSFVDNMNNSSANNNNLLDDKDALRSAMNNGKTLLNAATSQSQFQNITSSGGLNHFTMSQSQQSVFDFHSGSLNPSPSQQLPQNNNNVAASGFVQNRMPQYVPTSPNLTATNNNNNNNNNGLGLDFKLTEPSPAAQTLKQMAEQHQNMQQKQQQLGMTIGNTHPRSPFGSDSFPDPLSSIRNNFLNGSPTTINTIQKSPNNMFQSMGYSNQQNSSGPVTGPGTVKQEIGSPVPPMYSNMIPSPVPQMSDMEMHKRRQQVLQMQQQQQQQQQQRQQHQRSPFSPQNTNEKAMSHASGLNFPGVTPLSHYNDQISVGSASQGSASNSPISHAGQFIRGVSTPGVTPPPANFGSSPSPSGSTLHLTQNQQIQISQNSQLQVSQSQQQQMLVSQDMNPAMASQTQQQSRSFYSGHQPSVHMSQNQSTSFQFGGNAGNCSPKGQQRTQCPPASVQRHMPQYTGRPPPEYQPSHESSPLGPSPQMNAMNNHMVPATTGRGRKAAQTSYAQNVSQSANSMVMSTMPPAQGSGRGRGKARGAAANKQSYPRHQRPPNVNVGPEGLNISQRPPAIASDWRQVYIQQQQQQQLSSIRIPFTRTVPAQNYVQNNQNFPGVVMIPSTNAGAIPRELTNSNQASGNPQRSVPSNQNQMLMQHQSIMHNSTGQPPPNSHHMQLSSSSAMSLDSSHQQLFINSPKPTNMKLDQHSLPAHQNSNEFILDFLDDIDCSASDLLNFDSMQSSGTDFPLLDDIGMLGK